MKTIIDKFINIVKQYKNNVSLVVDKKEYSYLELDELSNRVAKDILKTLLNRQNPILVFDDHPLQIACSILGVMKSGNIVVPLSKRTPVKRVLEIIDSCDIKGYISLKKHPELQLPHIPIQYERDCCYSYCSSDNDDAYIIYTSGTTGKSKGVLVQHKGLLNSVLERNSILGIGKDSHSISLMGFSFDGFFMSFFSPLIAGAKLFLPNNVSDEKEICSILREFPITTFLCTPTFLNSLLICAEDGLLDEISLISLAGEPIGSILIEKVHERYPFIRIANEYGPTENSICTSINPDIRSQRLISAGRIIKNVEAKIVCDEKICSQGELGELYLSGVGLAKGYVNDEQLTNAKFVKQNKKIWYRTGDLAYWYKDELVICGRLDKQVKVNGYRIDLAEIENVVKMCSGIDNCVVTYNPTEGITAYWTSSLNIDREFIIGFLREHLNEYMLPANYIHVPSIPMFESGKIDYTSLCEIGKLSMDGEEKNENMDETTQRLCTLYSEILQIDKCNENTNFFAYGGNSLLLVVLCERIKKELDVVIDIEDIRLNPTPKQISDMLIEYENKSSCVKIQPFNRFWFIDCYFTSILAVIEYYSIPIAPFIRSFEILEVGTDDSYSLVYDYKKPMSEIFNDMGMVFDSGILENDFEDKVISHVMKHRVVMLHVDCFYIPYCKEKYKQEHFEHVVAIIGYDKESEEFDIIDQENLSSVSFGYHKAGLGDIREAAYAEIVNRETFDNMDFVALYQQSEWNSIERRVLDDSQFDFVVEKTIEYLKIKPTDLVHVMQVLLNYIKVEKEVFNYQQDDVKKAILQKREIQIMRFLMKSVALKKSDNASTEELIYLLEKWEKLK